ncbi:MAG: AAA family ATPase [Rhodospirillales bacterium]|nr:AAA family ATPase [Rhodospirillales bacterium]
MKLLSLTVKNFMPYKGEQKILFPSDPQQNVMLVFGDNMRGKTSFLNAIRWCFYGKALGRHLKEIENIDIVNWDAVAENDWNVQVNLIFENDGHEYDLRRTLQPKEMIYKPKTSNDFNSERMLRKDGSVVRGDLVEHELNQIMPEDIARFFLFDGELLQEYEMLLDDKDEQGNLIKESIEKVLGVPALIRGRNQIDTLLRDARKRQTKDAQQIDSVKRYSDELQKLEAEYETLDADLKTLQSQYESYQSQIEVLDEELQKSQSVQLGKERLDQREGEIKRAAARLEELQSEKLVLLKDAWKDLLEPLLQQKISEFEHERDKFGTSQKQRHKIEVRIDDLESLLKKSVCPTCDQKIEDNKRESIGAEVARLEAELEEFQVSFDRLGSISGEISKLSKIRPSGASSRIPNIDKEMRQMNLRVTELDSEIEDIKTELRGHDTAEIAKKRVRRDQLQQTIGVIKKNIDEQKRKIEENEAKQKKLSVHIETNAEARSNRSTRLVNVYAALKDIFSSSIDDLRNNLRQTVADFATEAFSNLTTETTYKGLKINENYGLTIVDREGRDVLQRSAGAEQIVALSLIDGLNRTARKTGPIIMDTPLGRLDLKHREQVLRYLPEMGEQVILLVHEGEIRKDEIMESLSARIGKVCNIERVSSSESKLTEA